MEKSFKCKITDLSRKTIYEGAKSKVKLNYYWDSHGELFATESDGETSRTFENVKVKVEEVERTMAFGDDEDAYTWTEWRVSINDETIRALDCREYYSLKDGTMVFKMIVGQG